jgi:hypothetical protein
LRTTTPGRGLAVLLVRDEQDAILGGLYGRVFSSGCTSSCFRCRNRGAVRVLARTDAPWPKTWPEKRCLGIWLDTFDFQAPEFYKKLGIQPVWRDRRLPAGA